MSAEWSRYWARETSGACLPGAPPAVQNILIEAWRALFAAEVAPVANRAAGVHLLDVASGGGSVLKIALQTRKDIVGIGIDAADVGPSAAALGVRGGIDAHALPFASATFDIVTSQFGLEYCGPPAWAEAVRVLAPRGRLMLICHHRDSAAVRHNGRRLAAMRAMASAGLFEAAARVAAGQAESPAMAGAIAAARQQHAGQSVTMELPAALGHWVRAGRADAVAAIRVEAEAEMARLAAMQSAALGEDEVAQRLAWLAPMAATARVIAGPDGPLGWVVSGARG